MTLLQLEGRDSLQGTQQTQDDETRKDIRVLHQRALGFLKTIEEQQDTSAEGQEKVYYTFNLAYAAFLSAPTFRDRVILPLMWTFESTVREIMPTVGGLLEQLLEEAKEEKGEELKCLHDYVVDDLSIEYHSSKDLYEDVKSLRRQHGLENS